MPYGVLGGKCVAACVHSMATPPMNTTPSTAAKAVQATNPPRLPREMAPTPRYPEKLEVNRENAGASNDAGLPPPVGIKCTKSIPATCTETVECPVAEDANDPGAQQVCGWLAKDGTAALTGEPDGRQMCTQIYGGPETATVTGTLDGKPVDATFSREDGCAIARFDAASTLWLGVQATTEPVGGGAAGSCLALPPDTPVSNDGPAAGGAADETCATPATPTPPAQAQPDVISDPPEAFDLEQ